MQAHGPLIVVFFVFGAVLLGFLAYWHSISTYLTGLTEPYRTGLQQAGIPIKSEALVFGVLGVAILPWGAYMALMRPPALIALLTLVVTSASSF
ncbi:MAG: hypothetical protein JO165_08920, partial [Candidatus Eremiobacteraeota bacterium]|nr:hypothetical protein [Candidatus Eremiobacteraeota bacterium]